MMYLVWELNPQLSVHEADTLPSELMRFYICQAGFEPTTFRIIFLHSYSICPANSSVGRASDCSSEGRRFKPGLADVKPH